MVNEEAIELLEEICELDSEMGAVHHEAIELAIQALKKQINGIWIPVNERLPEKDSYVLVTFDDGLVAGVECDNFGNWCLWEGRGSVMAWKPMIEGYKGGNKSEVDKIRTIIKS